MIDRLRQMAIFAKVIEAGSFRGAARILHLSPSVVSHHISQLEEHLGVALLYRSTRKLTLTPEGTRLLQATQRMLEAAEGELISLSGTAAEPSGELRITVPSVLSQSEFMDRLAEFAKRHPRVVLHLDFSDTRRDLIGDGFDLAIRMLPQAKTSATARRLFRVARRVVGSAEYCARKVAPSCPDDIANWDWLALTPVRAVPLAFQRNGIEQRIAPNAMVFSNDAQSMAALVRSGLGIAAVPDFLVAEDMASGRVKEVLPQWHLPPIDVVAHWSSNAPKHGLVHRALVVLSDVSKA